MLNLNLYTHYLFGAVPPWVAWVGMGLGAGVAFVFGTPTLALVFVALIVLDAVGGIAVSHKRGEPITSDKFRRTVYKCLAYFSALLVAAVLDLVLGTPLHTLAFGWFAISEAVSIGESIEALLNGHLPFLKRLRKMLKRYEDDGA